MLKISLKATRDRVKETAGKKWRPEILHLLCWPGVSNTAQRHPVHPFGYWARRHCLNEHVLLEFAAVKKHTIEKQTISYPFHSDNIYFTSNQFVLTCKSKPSKHCTNPWLTWWHAIYSESECVFVLAKVHKIPIFH